MYHSCAVMPSRSTPDPGPKGVADQLRSLRLARFMTQEALAEASGVGRATIARIESGHTTPQIRTIHALARALAVRPEELVASPDALWKS